MNGGIEAGGAKFICGAGSRPEISKTNRIPTTTPGETIAAAVDWLRTHAVRAVGIGSFGPLDLNPKSACLSDELRTRKEGWRNFDW